MVYVSDNESTGEERLYDRTDAGLPQGWIARMKNSMRTISPAFSTSRMVKEYANLLYVPTAKKRKHFVANGFQAAKALSRWKRDLSEHWCKLRIEEVQANDALRSGKKHRGSPMGTKYRNRLEPRPQAAHEHIKQRGWVSRTKACPS